MMKVGVASINFSNTSNLIFNYDEGMNDSNLWPRKFVEHSIHIRCVLSMLTVRAQRRSDMRRATVGRSTFNHIKSHAQFIRSHAYINE